MKIQYYFLKRCKSAILVLLGISVITFYAAMVVPSEPAARWIGPRATAEQIAAARVELGLDQPIYQQYFTYMFKLFQGDWGVSIESHQPVLDEIGNYLPASLELIGTGMFFGITFGVALGILSAAQKNTLLDHLARIVSVGSVSFPTFWLAMMLQLIFFRTLEIFPLSDRIDLNLRFIDPLTEVTGFYILDSIITGNWAALKSSLLHIVLPALALGAYPMGLITRMIRGGLIEVLNEDYIRLAEAYSIPGWLIKCKYALKNAVNPTITVIPIMFAYALTSTFLIEAVFNWPGLGSYVANAILISDYPVIMGVTLFVALVYVISNLMVDIIHSLIDPRIILG